MVRSAHLKLSPICFTDQFDFAVLFVRENTYSILLSYAYIVPKLYMNVTGVVAVCIYNPEAIYECHWTCCRMHI